MIVALLTHTFYLAEMLNHILSACNNIKPWGIVLSGAPSVNRTDPEYLKASAVRNDMVELLVELNVYPDPHEMTMVADHWVWKHSTTH